MSASSCHPDFPEGMKVINIKQTSSYYGERGTVYGGRPSTDGGRILVLVKWDRTEEALAYVANRLAIAPSEESSYQVSKRTRNGHMVKTHEVPAITKRARPTIFEQFARKNEQ